MVTSATEIGNTRPSTSLPESVAKIHEVSFYSLTSSTWDDLASVTDVLPSPDTVDLLVRGGDPFNGNNLSNYYNNQNPAGVQPQVFEHPCLPLTKILSSGSFYYALEPHWDLSTRLGARLGVGGQGPATRKTDLGAFDERFVWNEYIIRSLLDFRERLDAHEREDLDRCQFIVRLWQFIPTCFRIASNHRVDPSHPRVCWSFDDGFSCPTYRRLTDHCDALAYLAAGLEARWNTVQYARSGR